MREHEVPTHVQAEDRVLLGFTFPQVVAVMAVFALSYGAYRYTPVGPSEVRMALAVLFGLVGVAMVVGKIGGRRLPLVAADLLKYRLGARRYAGQTAQLVRAEPPAPAQPVKTGPGPIRLMVRKARRGLRRQRKKTRQSRERRNGRMRWFGKRRGKDGGNRQRHDNMAERLEIRRRKPHRGFLAIAALAILAAAIMAVPQAALADDHEPWLDEIDFEVKEPVTGRRIFVEALTVTGDRAAVTLRPPPPWTSASGPSAARRGAGCASGARQRWPRGSASTTRFPCTARNPPSPSRGRTRWDRPGRSRSSTSRSRTRCPKSRESSATCGSRPWAGRRERSAASSSPSASRTPITRWSFRWWPGTRASPRRP